jgi:ATP-dependent Clp protease ATP-binding subunit ClpA
MKFSKEFDDLVKNSRETAVEFGWSFISSYHFLIGILKSDNLPNRIFKTKNWEFEQLSKSLIKEKSKAVDGNYYLTKELETSIKNAKFYSWIYGATEIKPEHLMFAMLADKKSDAGKYLNSVGMDYSEFKSELESIKELKANNFLESIGKNNLAVQIGIPKLINKLIKNVA